MAGIIALVSAQWTAIPMPTTSFTGQTIIVTGSNVGLGLESARHFVRLNAARVILAVRTLSKGEAAKADIESTTKRQNVIEIWEVDMSNYESIKKFAKKCESLDRLDVLVANAGVLKDAYEEAEGTEVTIAVNVIGTFLLVLNVLPVMRKSKQKTGMTSRITVTSSIVHEMAKFAERKESSIFEAFEKDNNTYMADRYNTSKLLEVFLVRSIAEAMNESPNSAVAVILNNVNPGFCHSELTKDVQGAARYGLKVMKALLARTTEVGSRNLVNSAAAGEESHGQYMTECKVRQPGNFVLKPDGVETQRRVHAELMAILERIQPGITKNI